MTIDYVWVATVYRTTKNVHEINKLKAQVYTTVHFNSTTMDF